MKLWPALAVLCLLSASAVDAQQKKTEKLPEKVKQGDMYWILLKDGSYLQGQLVILPDGNYKIINSDYLDGRLLKKQEIEKIGNTDFRALTTGDKQPPTKHRVGGYLGMLKLPGEASPIYGVAPGFGLFHNLSLGGFSRYMQRFFIEPRAEFYLANSGDEQFGNMMIVRAGAHLGFRVFSLDFWGQGLDALAGAAYSLNRFTHQSDGANTFHAVIGQFTAAYTIYSINRYAWQVSGGMELEKQSSLVFSYRVDARFLYLL